MEQTQQTGVIPFTTADLQSAGTIYQTAQKYEEKYRAKQSALLDRAKEAGEKIAHADVVYEPKYKAVARVSKKRSA